MARINRIIQALLSMVLVLVVIPSVGLAYSGGQGTIQIPYLISTPEDLIQLGQSPWDYDKHFMLNCDLDLE